MALDAIVDEQLRRATRAGAFDNLPGAGRPLRLEENPFADPSVRMAHHLLRSNGYTLPWIAERQEIDFAVEQARQRLLNAAYTSEHDATAWRAATDAFRQEASALNRRILVYNLRVPSSLVQRAPIDVMWETERVRPLPQIPVAFPTPSEAQPIAPVPSLATGYRELLITYLAPQWRRVVVLAVLLFGSIGLELVSPQVVRSFIDTARSGGSFDVLVRAAWLYVAAVCVGQLLGAGATYLSADVGWTATNALRSDLLLHCLRLDLRFHQRHTPGELIERVDGDVALLANFFAQFVVQVLGNGLLLIGVLVLLFREDWRVGLALLAYVGLVLGVLRHLQSIAVPAIKAMRQASAALIGFWEERLLGTEDIRANGAQVFVQHQHAQLNRSLLERGRMSVVMFRVYAGAWEVLFALGNAAVFALGAFLLGKGTLTLGAVYLIFAYTGVLSLHLGRITDQLNDLQNAAAAISRINELRLTRNPIADSPGTALPLGPLAVAFEHVSFSYRDEGTEEPRTENREPLVQTNSSLITHHSSRILHDISFRLEAGQVLGLLGRTGSGKSTLVRLLFRFYDPTSGVILLNGIDLRQTRLSDLRARIGMVTQEVQLFAGSVRDNLTLFNEQIDDERIVRAMDELGLHEWFERLPMGLDTELGGSGSGFSGGEAQLLAFTRVLLQNPGLIILDEASSRLDPATERLLERALDRLLAGRTAIIIAHRLSTVARADMILVLEDGVISRQEAKAADSTSDPCFDLH